MKQVDSLSDEEERCIAALGGFDCVCTTVDAVLQRYGFQRGLFTTSERRVIPRPRSFQMPQVELRFDPCKSLRANINDLLDQASELQATAGGTNYVGAMLQHLVGAKLDIVLGKGKLSHHGFSVADHSTDRNADFQMEGVTIHVTTHPTEALVRKCDNNIKAGLKPIIITLAEAVRPAAFILKTFELNDRVDVLDAAQFLTANVYERSLFKTADYKLTLGTLLGRYNEIVAECETDPSLIIRLPATS
jgi:Domain of unknown function (DUF4928)